MLYFKVNGRTGEKETSTPTRIRGAESIMKIEAVGWRLSEIMLHVGMRR